MARHPISIAVLLPVVSLLLGLNPARANGPEVGFDAGTIVPIDSRVIQLVSEAVRIRLDREDGLLDRPAPNAECTYLLRNLGDSTRTFTMAFVANDPISPEISDSWNEMYGRALFLVEQDGRTRTVRFVKGRRRDFKNTYETDSMSISLPVWSLTIGPLATSRVRMRYRAVWSGGCDGSNCGSRFTYYARPASRWAGRIERATFVLDVGDPSVVRRLRRIDAPWQTDVSPAGYQWTRGGISWKFRNWEPDSDLAVSIHWDAFDDGGDPAWDPWTPDSLASLPEITRDLDRAAEVADSCAWCEECGGHRLHGPHGDKAWPAATVHLRVLVEADGRAHRVRWLGHAIDGLGSDPEACVQRWRFRPAIRAGKPVAAWTDVEVKYPPLP
jgi:hypothetical protein